MVFKGFVVLIGFIGLVGLVGLIGLIGTRDFQIAIVITSYSIRPPTSIPVSYLMKIISGRAEGIFLNYFIAIS